VWEHLASLVIDDIDTRPGGKPSNKSNRFDVAESINEALSPPGGPWGPFWCSPPSRSAGSRRTFVPQCRPRPPFETRGGMRLDTHRVTDLRAKSDTPFRLFGNGSVGSQVLTGIPCLHRLRFHPALCETSALWPFETGWAGDASWPSDAVRIVHAEIYPSVRPPLADTVKDRGQVRAMWHWARDLDAKGAFAREFAIPAGVVAGSPDEVAIREEEGWILGCPR
jgi:precorrin-8X/cobalt-precorrin-8 methylmutase